MKELFEQVRGSRDELNQYSFPFGLPELRHAIADYTQECYGYRPDPEERITVVLGASEGMAAAALSDPAVKAVVVNTPQNPTGKVLDEEELGFIAELCRTHDRFAITDEIDEHITFDGHRHRCLARCEGMAERTLVVNSISRPAARPGGASAA